MDPAEEVQPRPPGGRFLHEDLHGDPRLGGEAGGTAWWTVGRIPRSRTWVVAHAIGLHPPWPGILMQNLSSSDWLQTVCVCVTVRLSS